MTHLLLILIGYIFINCSHSQEAPDWCGKIDWYEFGRQDGAKGSPMRGFGIYQKNCQIGHPGSPHQKLYESGHNLGLVEYCTGDMGLEVGKSGRPYRYVCPEPLETIFLETYQRGIRIHELEKENNDLNTQIKTLSRQLHHSPDISNQLQQLQDRLTKNTLVLKTLEHSR